jgi:hypothetical protein
MGKGKQSSRRKKDSGTAAHGAEPTVGFAHEQKPPGVVLETSDVESPERPCSFYRDLLQAACKGDYDTIIRSLHNSQMPFKGDRAELGIGIDLNTLVHPPGQLDHPTLQLTALQAAVAFDRRTNTDRNTNANAIMVLLQYGAVRI